MNQPIARRYNPEACDLKHRGLNTRVKQNEEDITDLKAIAIRLTTLAENSQRSSSGWINTPAGLLKLKVSLFVVIALICTATGINIFQLLSQGGVV